MTKRTGDRGSGLWTRRPLRRLQVGKLAMNLLVGVALTVVSTGTAHALSYAYVSAYTDDTVKKIFLADNTVVKTITVGDNPHSCAASPDGSEVWVTNADANTVSVIATATNTVSATTAVGASPRRIVVSRR